MSNDFTLELINDDVKIEPMEGCSGCSLTCGCNCPACGSGCTNCSVPCNSYSHTENNTSNQIQQSRFFKWEKEQEQQINEIKTKEVVFKS